MSDKNEVVKLNRRLLASAVVRFGELYVKLNGDVGLNRAIHAAFGKDQIGASPNAVGEWLRQIEGWPGRREAALKAYRDRVAGIDPNHPELRRLEKALQHAQGELSSLREKVKAVNEKETVFEQLSDVMQQIVEPLDVVDAEVDFGTSVKGQHPVDFVAALTDEHADEVINGPTTWGLERYNFDVFCLRLERWAKLIVQYATEHLPKHHVERLHVFKLGDSLHGDGHGNKNRNHFGNTMRAAVAVADAEAEAIAWMLKYLPYVNVIGISGNHPRTTVKKDHVDPHDNFDFAVTAMIAARLSRYVEEGRLDVHAPKSWSAFVDVRGKTFALNHGDDVVGTWGIPWYGFAKKQARVQAMVGRKAASVDFFWYGHHHTDVAVTEAGARGIHSGAFTMTDGWTLEKLSAGGEPMQAMMVVDDHPGMRARLLDVPIWLRDVKAEAAFWSGKVAPSFGRTNTLTQLAGSDAVAGGGDFPVIRARK